MIVSARFNYFYQSHDAETLFEKLQKIDRVNCQSYDGGIPRNTPRALHVETTWKRAFPRRINVENTWCDCRD